MVDVLSRERPAEDTRTHADVSIQAGGTAVNVALAAVRAGAAATVVGRVGSGPAAELVLATLAQHDVEARLARDPVLRTGAAVSLGTSVVADRGANAALDVADLPDPLAADALFVSGFALLQSGSADAAAAALTQFRGDLAAVDLASPKLARDAELAGIAANVIFATSEEARAVTGCSPEDAARALREHFEIV
ncbi:MAG TPA: PfkB family carbohydrate kinase, partial [Gaiellaceae bacterium]